MSRVVALLMQSFTQQLCISLSVFLRNLWHHCHIIVRRLVLSGVARTGLVLMHLRHSFFMWVCDPVATDNDHLGFYSKLVSKPLLFICPDWSLWELMLKPLTDRSYALRTLLAHFIF